MRLTIAITNQKGGVGKTTTAINLAAELASRSIQTLLIDLDPQGNASTGLGIPTPAREFGSYRAFSKESGSPRTYPTSIPGLSVLPASMNLAGVEMELTPLPDRAMVLRSFLANWPKANWPEADWDVVIMDCPPSFGLLTVNALVAADAVLVPLQCEFFALEGLAQLRRTVDALRTAYNPRLAILGILLTMFDRRNSLSELVASDARKFFGDIVLQTVIPRNVRLGEAPSHGKPIQAYDPKSPGAIAYQRLATEILARVPGQFPQHG